MAEEEEFTFGQQEASADAEHTCRPVGLKVSQLSPVLKRKGSSHQQQQQFQQPDSPGAELSTTPRRRVLFADTAGFPLSRGDSMEKLDDCNGAQLGPLALRPEFTVCGSTAELLELVRRQKVALESLEVSPAGDLLGIVRVHGSSRDKQVHLRWSRDAWRSHWEVRATAVDNTFDGETEQFAFRGFAKPAGDAPLAEGHGVEMVVRYSSPDGVIWDNNRCSNYGFTCVKAGEEMRARRVKALVTGPEPNGCSLQTSNDQHDHHDNHDDHDDHDHDDAAPAAGDLRNREGAGGGDDARAPRADANREPRGDRRAAANGASLGRLVRQTSVDDLREGVFKTLHVLLLLVFLASLTRFGVGECCVAYVLALGFLYWYGVFEMLSH